MRRILLASVAALAPAMASAAEYPFVGKWDCEVSTFTFTNRIYNNGSENLPYTAIRFGKANDVTLEFAKGYKISLQGVGAKTMSWHSHESGDTFSCKRLP